MFHFNNSVLNRSGFEIAASAIDIHFLGFQNSSQTVFQSLANTPALALKSGWSFDLGPLAVPF
jgi:hypothetical protein